MLQRTIGREHTAARRKAGWRLMLGVLLMLLVLLTMLLLMLLVMIRGHKLSAAALTALTALQRCHH